MRCLRGGRRGDGAAAGGWANGGGANDVPVGGWNGVCDGCCTAGCEPGNGDEPAHPAPGANAGGHWGVCWANAGCCCSTTNAGEVKGVGKACGKKVKVVRGGCRRKA